MAEMRVRSKLSPAVITRHPSPSLPMRFAAGTGTLSKLRTPFCMLLKPMTSFNFSTLKAAVAFLHNERGEVAVGADVIGIAARPGIGHVSSGYAGGYDISLLAPQDIGVALPSCRGLYGGGVRPGKGLGDDDRPYLSLADARKEALFCSSVPIEQLS